MSSLKRTIIIIGFCIVCNIIGHLLGDKFSSGWFSGMIYGIFSMAFLYETNKSKQLIENQSTQIN